MAGNLAASCLWKYSKFDWILHRVKGMLEKIRFHWHRSQQLGSYNFLQKRALEALCLVICLANTGQVTISWFCKITWAAEQSINKLRVMLWLGQQCSKVRQAHSFLLEEVALSRLVCTTGCIYWYFFMKCIWQHKSQNNVQDFYITLLKVFCRPQIKAEISGFTDNSNYFFWKKVWEVKISIW